MLRTVGLQLRIAGRLLVDQLDWQVTAGQCWCVIGPNGAGKSTLLHTLAGLREPALGAVHVQGRALSDWPLATLARQRAYLQQGRNDAFNYSVLDTVLSARHVHHAGRYWESAQDQQAALAALESLDATHLWQRDVRTLSGGERQRVAVAAALAQDTPLLLLDEPTNALDLAHQVSVTYLLASLCRSAGKAIVMAIHDLNQARATATHALLLAGDGSWHAGPVGQIMTASLLSDCLGHPIDVLRHGARTLYFPKEQPDG